MSLTKNFKTNQKKEIEGVAIPMPANDDGTVPTFTVARSGSSNTRYTKALERVMRPHQAAQRTKTLGEEMARSLLRQAFVEGCLLNWQNVLLSDVSGDVEAVGFAPFNIDNANTLFAKLPDLYDQLQLMAADVALYREGETEAVVKN